MLTQEERISLVKFRIEKSHQVFAEAKAVASLGFWNLAGNRLYYAVFHMATALLLSKGLSARSHAGVMHMIGMKFIANGPLDKSYGRLFSRLYELRQSGDYDDMFDATESEVKPYFEKTEALMSAMQDLTATE